MQVIRKCKDICVWKNCFISWFGSVILVRCTETQTVRNAHRKVGMLRRAWRVWYLLFVHVVLCASFNGLTAWCYFIHSFSFASSSSHNFSPHLSLSIPSLCLSVCLILFLFLSASLLSFLYVCVCARARACINVCETKDKQAQWWDRDEVASLSR